MIGEAEDGYLERDAAGRAGGDMTEVRHSRAHVGGWWLVGASRAGRDDAVAVDRAGGGAESISSHE